MSQYVYVGIPVFMVNDHRICMHKTVCFTTSFIIYLFVPKMYLVRDYKIVTKY